MKQWGLQRAELMQDVEWHKLRSHLDREAELAKLHKTTTAIQDRAICYVAVWTGLRRQEIASLQVGDLFLKNEHPFIVVRQGKGDKYREVFISPTLRALLKSFVQARGLVGDGAATKFLFRPQRGERYTSNGIYRVWRTACEAAGIIPRSIHKARHYYGLKQYEATKDMRFVQKQLGHSRIATTQVYVDISGPAAQENLEAFDKALNRVG